MGDVVGRLFREFAITLGVTILISAVVSLTLTPMMCAKLLRHVPKEEQNRVAQWSQRQFDRVIEFYGTTLRWILEHQTATLIVAVGTLVFTVFLYVIVPKGFFPVQDSGIILGISEAPQSIFVQGDGRTSASPCPCDPAGPGGKEPVHLHRCGRHQHHPQQRTDIHQFEAQGGGAGPTQPRSSAVSSRSWNSSVESACSCSRYKTSRWKTVVARTQFQYTLESPNAAELNMWTPKLVDALRTLPQLLDVSSDQQEEGLRTTLKIDRSTASRFGITPQLIDDTLYDAFGQRQVSTMFTQLNQYRVVLEVKPEFQANPSSLRTIYIRSTAGGPGASQCDHGIVRRNRTACHKPPGTVPRRDAVVQSGLRGFAGRCGGRHRDGHPADGLARLHTRKFSGHGPGVPGISHQ